jgi:hypothetical protein
LKYHKTCVVIGKEDLGSTGVQLDLDTGIRI